MKTLPCSCKHEYQDQQYGKGLRLHNEAKGPTGTPMWRCAVCGNKRGG